METVVVKNRIGKTVLGIIASALLAIAAAALTIFSEVTIIGIVGILFFGIGTIFLIRQAIKNKPILTINENGYIDPYTADSIGLIPWSEVDDVQLLIHDLPSEIPFTKPKVKFLTVFVRNPEKLKEKLSDFEKDAIKLNLDMGFGFSSISFQLADKKCEDVIEIMNNYCKAYREKNPSLDEVLL